MKRTLAYISLLTAFGLCGQGLTLKSVQEALDLAEKNSYTSKLAVEQRILARTTVQSAYGNAFNPKIPVNASITDNAKLPVNFIPAEAFGGPSGTYRQITLGQRYIALMSVAPQFEILNFGNIAKIKSAKINEALTESNALLTKKNLFEQVSASYHNILSFQAQIEVLLENQKKADSILYIVKNKYEQGLVRKQDLNDAEVNKITITDKIEQTQLQLQQQYLSLQALCDSEVDLSVSQSLWELEPSTGAMQATSDLSLRNSELQKSFASAEYGASKWANLPTLALATSFNWQNNSNRRFFDNSQPWINSNYWSLRLSWDFPTNIPKLTTMKSAQVNYRMARIQAEHTALQSKIQNEQMEKDYQKATGQHVNADKIFLLKQENYLKSKNQYEANILPLDRLLIAHNDLLVSQINVAMALANISFTKSKIEINNQIK